MSHKVDNSTDQTTSPVQHGVNPVYRNRDEADEALYRLMKEWRDEYNQVSLTDRNNVNYDYDRERKRMERNLQRKERKRAKRASRKERAAKQIQEDIIRRRERWALEDSQKDMKTT